MRPLRLLASLFSRGRWVLFLALVGAPRAEETPSAPAAESPAPEMTLDDLFETGRALFEAVAPEEVKEQYEYPSREAWLRFQVQALAALQGTSSREAARLRPLAESLLAQAQKSPELASYADWLRQRIDFFRAAEEASGPPPAAPADSASPPPPDTPQVGQNLRDRSRWDKRVALRPVPKRAEELMPVLKEAFAREGVPVEWVWLAEVESTLNPRAESPAGARGLFQLMPATAKSLGLSLWPFDERVHPEKSARAAARLLHRLHGRFKSWPLALAAYNAGEGRVAVALKKNQAATFEGAAVGLPLETQMYVPKVLATVAHRESVEPESLPAPRLATAPTR